MPVVSVLTEKLFLLEDPWGKALLIVHLLVAGFALGAVTHHWWTVNFTPTPAPKKMAVYTKWMAISYVLSWVIGAWLYPAYNAFVRHTAGGLDEAVPWAVSVFEWKEHFGTFALLMLPWLVLSARRLPTLAGPERVSYKLGTWVFTVLVYFTFVAGALVTLVRSV